MKSCRALFVVDFLLRHGNERFVADVRARAEDVGKLRAYKYIEDGRDIAGEVRQKAAQVYAFMMDDKKLKEEREKAKKAREYAGVIGPDEVEDEYVKKPIKKTSHRVSEPAEKASKSGKAEQEEVRVKTKKPQQVQEESSKRPPKKSDADSQPKPKKKTESVPSPDVAPKGVSNDSQKALVKPNNDFGDFDFLNALPNKKPAEHDVDFDEILSGKLMQTNLNSNQGWASVFAGGRSDTMDKIIDTKKDAIVSFTFDAAPEEFGVTSADSTDLWKVAAHLIDKNNQPVQKLQSKGKSIRELREEQERGQNNDFFGSIGNPQPQKVVAPVVKQAPETIGFDMYGLPILAPTAVPIAQQKQGSLANMYQIPVVKQTHDIKQAAQPDPFGGITWK